jgi:hypothetical protein
VTQQNTTAAEALASGASQLSLEAEQLKEAVAFFRAEEGQGPGAPSSGSQDDLRASKPALRVVRPGQGFNFDLADRHDELDASFQRPGAA